MKDLFAGNQLIRPFHFQLISSFHLRISARRGGFPCEIKKLREKLIHIASMIELELDFSDEDTEFADRQEMNKLIGNLLAAVTYLLESFNLGNILSKFCIGICDY